MSQLKIYLEVDNIINDYINGRSERFDNLYRSPFKVIKMAEFYSWSRYLDVYKVGTVAEAYNKDGLGRDKPFYNIVNYRVALAKTATDLDIKDIQITSDNPKHQVESMLLNREAYEWMKDPDGGNFSVTLNKMGYTRPKYGGYLLKKTMVKGVLKIDVVDWTKVYTDVIDIMGGPIIEVHPMSPVQLKKKADVWENVDDVIYAFRKQKEINKENKINVYEVLGEFCNDIYNNFNGEGDKDGDDYEYTLQRYFLAEIGGVKYPLYSEKVSGVMEDYYDYLSWEDQSLDLGRGVIEDSEEAQVWTNDSVINEKNAMDLAGKVGVKTTSRKIGGTVLAHDLGKVYELEQGTDINAFSFTPSALGQFQNQIDKWKSQADNVTNSYDAATGQQPPSGTPYSQTALLNQVATKPFDYKRQEWGIHLSKVFTKWVIPYLVKKIKKGHILVSEFSDVELEAIDKAFAIENSNKDMINAVFDAFDNGTPPPTQADQQQNIEGYRQHIKGSGKKRYIEIPDDAFTDIESKVTVVTTGEQKNKAATLQSLNTIMQTVIQSMNPQTGEFMALKDPVLRRVFDEIVEIAGSGISPVALGISGELKPSAPQPSPIQPQVAPQASPLSTTNQLS
jgi:hypothetical protein